MSNNVLEAFEKAIKDKGGKVLVYFSAPWCSQCKMMAPVIEELEKDITVVKIDAEQEMELANVLLIQSLPALRLYKDGNWVESMTGYQHKETIEKGFE